MQCFLRKADEWAEVQAALQQHANIRPAPTTTLLRNVGWLLALLLSMLPMLMIYLPSET